VAVADEATHVRSFLAGLKTALGTAVATAIDDVASDGGLEPTDPSGVDATQDAELETRLPRVKIAVDGMALYGQWLTPQIDLQIPLVAIIIMHESDNPETADQTAHEYTRALEIAISRSYTTAGAHHYLTRETGVLPVDPEQPRRRIGMVRGTALVRTSRVEA
jgi:hypothetical protein